MTEVHWLMSHAVDAGQLVLTLCILAVDLANMVRLSYRFTGMLVHFDLEIRLSSFQFQYLINGKSPAKFCLLMQLVKKTNLCG